MNIRKRLLRLKSDVNLAWRVIKVSRRYARQLRRVRQKVRKNGKIRVLFVVSEIAKWKEQKLYEEMEKSGLFDPIVGISAWNGQSEVMCPDEKLLEVFAHAEAFFDRLGDRHVRTVELVNGKRIVSDLSEFDPDVVYYTEPHHPCGEQASEFVSRYALTCYSPYYVPNYDIGDQECHLYLHLFLWRYFCLGEFWSRHLASTFKFLDHVEKFVPTGHPALDFFSSQRNRKPKGNCVIYAPHCSVPHPTIDYFPQYYGTFDWNGMEILEYARHHPEIQWVFKPHPVLRYNLVNMGLYSEAEVDAYYAAWAKLGTVCTDGDYQDLFLDSRAMITDCGSFLTEYGATGRPVIHLISRKNCRTPAPPSKIVYDTYYRVHNLDELQEVFQIVLEEGLDPKREERLAAVKQAGIAEVNASANIVRYLTKVLRG